MKNQGKKQTFELSTLNADNLIELSGFESTQNQLIVDNPFQEITDNKTFEIAKQRRTALKTGRTTIQNQDKTIGSFLSSFRKGTKAIAEKLIGITKDAEEIQQAEIDRFQAIKDEEKRLADEAEENRVQELKEGINTTVDLLRSLVSEMTLENFESNREKFEMIVENSKDQDFEIFQFLLDEGIEIQKESMLDKINEINTDESKRLEQLFKDQQSKIDSLFREGTEMIDNALIDTFDLLKPALWEIFNIDFDFGKHQIKFQEMVDSVSKKAESKIASLKEEKERNLANEIQIQKNSVINLREGLLDLVFQMTPKDFADQKTKIEEALEQPSVSVKLAQDEFDKMVIRVNESLKRKLEEIAVELKKINEEKEAEQTRLNELFISRKKTVLKTGIKFEQDYFKGFGKFIHVSEISGINDIEFNDFIDMIKNAKKQFNANDRKEKSRQTKLKQQKNELIDLAEKLMITGHVDVVLKRNNVDIKGKDKEMLCLFDDAIIDQINNWKSLIEKIKSF